MNALVVSNARRWKVSIAIPLIVEVAFFAWLAWYTNPFDTPAELTFRFLQFLLPVAAMLAIPIALVVAVVEGLLPEKELLVGWEKAERIAMWYIGMAGVAIAGFLSVHDMNYYVGEVPLYDPLVQPLALIFGVYYYGAFAAAMFIYIAMDGPLLRDREITRLPLRATVLLGGYTCTSILWFVLAFVLQGNQYDIVLFNSVVLDALAITGLWAGWWLLRLECNATRVILWNTAFVSWLVLFAHPPIIFKGFWT